MAKFTCVHAVCLLIVAQLVLIVLGVYIRQQLMRKYNSFDFSTNSMIANQLNMLAFWFNVIVVVYLHQMNRGPSGYFMKHTLKCFKYCYGIWILLAVVWGIVVNAWLIWANRLIFIIPNFFVMFASSLACIVVVYSLKQQRNEYTYFVKRAIELNSTSQQTMTADQAHTLFLLNGYRKIIENLRKFRESPKKKDRKHGVPRGSVQWKATQFDDYFQLSHWIHEIEQQEKANELESKIRAEMQERLPIYSLTDEERIQLGILAKWEDLKVPGENWHNLMAKEPLNNV